MKALIVEDMTSVRKELKELLKEMGITDIQECGDGESALELCYKESFDLILSDIHMPNLSGLSFLKNLKLIPTCMKTPFIIISSDNQQESVIEAISEGASDYILKPFNKEMVFSKIRRVLPIL